MNHAGPDSPADDLTDPDTGPDAGTASDFELPPARPARPARRSGVTPAAPATGAQEALHNELVLLLSKLEFDRVGLATLPPRRLPAAVQAAVAMMDAVVARAEQPPWQVPPGALAQALALAGEFYSAAQAFLKANDDSPLRALLGLFGRAAPTEAERRRQFRDVSGRFVGVLGHFLALGGGGLPPGAAASWAQAHGVFLDDLKQVMARLVD